MESEVVGTLVAGKYRIKKRIGAGGMGAVYEGEHVEIGKRVAIKVIEHEHARSDELAARFRREARAASAVESEHIVQVFDVGHDEKVGLYMVMEYLVGEDLSSRLENAGGHIGVDDAVTIIAQAGRALGKAHAAGVVHRDLKPANLFLTTREDGSVSVKILDFGISKLMRPDAEGKADAKSSNLTREGSVIGTPMYMSPEQAQGLPVDARSDIWSLASVLYEALAGRTPYEHRDTYEQMIVQIVTKKPRPIREVAPWVPEEIASVIAAALVHELDARESSAAGFAKKLADAARVPRVSVPDVGSSATVLAPYPSSGKLPAETPAAIVTGASPPTGTGVVVRARTRLEEGVPFTKRPIVLIAVAAIALVAGVGVVAMVTREPTPSPTPASGLVAPAPVPNAPSATSTPSSPTVIVSATPELPAGPSPSVTGVPSSRAAPIGAVDAGARPTGRPVGTAAATATAAPTKQGPSVVGAPGTVSTVY